MEEEGGHQGEGCVMGRGGGRRGWRRGGHRECDSKQWKRREDIRGKDV